MQPPRSPPRHKSKFQATVRNLLTTSNMPEETPSPTGLEAPAPSARPMNPNQIAEVPITPRTSQEIAAPHNHSNGMIVVPRANENRPYEFVSPSKVYRILCSVWLSLFILALVIGIILAILYATGTWHGPGAVEVAYVGGNGKRGEVSDPSDFVNGDGRLEFLLVWVMGICWALAVGRLARWWG